MKNIQKFLDILYDLGTSTQIIAFNELYSHAAGEIIKGRKTDYATLKQYMENSKTMAKNKWTCFEAKDMIAFIEDEPRKAPYFVKFYTLSAILRIYSFNDREVYDIFKYFVTKNIELGIDDFKKISIDEEGQKYTKTVWEYYVDLFANDVMQFIENKKEVTEALLGNIGGFLPGKLNQELFEIFSKEEKLTEEDIEKARISLQHLLIGEENIEKCVRHMKKMIEKHTEKAKIPLKKCTYKGESSIEYITDKEYKALQKQLKEYYNPYTLEIKKDMDYDKLLELAAIMHRLGYEEADIKRFIKFGLEKAVSLDPMIGSFSQYYDKLKYYYGEEELQDNKDILGEMMICSNEEYVEWKKMFESEFKPKQKVLVSECGYEFEKAKRNQKKVS